MSTVLDSIIAGVIKDLEVRKLKRPNIESDVQIAPKVIDAHPRLKNQFISVISEIKRNSPSKGELAEISDPVELALLYKSGGASAISVLTEERRFKGNISDFQSIRSAMDLPMLRKDFIVDLYQVYESRAIGADIQLLIVAALDRSKLKDFYQLGSELGMASLFEVHNVQELEIAMALDPKIVGVNCRNLKTLDLNFSIFNEVLPQIPSNLIRVAESGISSRSEVEILEGLGADAILVGESLVKSASPSQAIAALQGR